MRKIAVRMMMGAVLLCFIAANASAAPGEDAIPPGTEITLHNWRAYERFMPDGMRELFQGNTHWKLPADFRLEIGPTHHYRPPETYIQNTRKYSRLVKIVNLADGGRSIAGYVAGLPFPDPAEPLKGWKILVNDWYAYVPYVICSSHQWIYVEDRFNNVNRVNAIMVYRRLSHISDIGAPTDEPQAQGVDYVEYDQIEQPEQAKYTTDLTIYYDDPAKPEDLFIFIPALRRSLRLSAAARCSPVFGTDYTQDDVRGGGFNGGITRFDARYLGDQKTLALLDSAPQSYGDIANYYRPVFFPKPAAGKWQVRDSYKIDVRRIPAQREGYCFGKRIMYVDKEYFLGSWIDLYDANMKLWKSDHDPDVAARIPGEGLHVALAGAGQIWDFQNAHMTLTMMGLSHGPSNTTRTAGTTTASISPMCGAIRASAAWR